MGGGAERVRVMHSQTLPLCFRQAGQHVGQCDREMAPESASDHACCLE